MWHLIILYTLVPIFWLIFTFLIPKIFPVSLFRNKANYILVKFASFVVFILFIDSLIWAIPHIIPELQKAEVIQRPASDIVAFFNKNWVQALSKWLVLLLGIIFYYFLRKSGQVISNSFAVLENANQEIEKTNKELKSTNIELESVSKRIEALVDFGKELNKKIYAGEDAIREFIQQQADQFMNTDNMYIAMYDAKSDLVSFPLFYKNGKQSNISSRKAGKGRTEEIIKTSESILIKNREDSKNWYQQPGREEYIGDELASWIGTPMKNSDNQVLGVVATYHPTENNLYDENDLRVLESMSDLAVIAIENARMVQRLKDVQSEIAERERELVLGGFAMDFTHKINNLVGPMLPWVTLLKRKLSEESRNNERVKYYLERINRDISLILSEAKQLRQPLSSLESINLEELILGILGQVELMANENVEIRFEKKADSVNIEGVKQQLGVAIYSIIHNGLKALQNGGVLSVTLDKGICLNQKNCAKVAIRDTGIGIEKMKQESIFDFGFTQWEGQSGTGYGLWRAKSIIQSFGGTLQLTYSEVGKGAEFTVCFPPSKPKNEIQ